MIEAFYESPSLKILTLCVPRVARELSDLLGQAAVGQAATGRAANDPVSTGRAAAGQASAVDYPRNSGIDPDLWPFKRKRGTKFIWRHLMFSKI